MGKVLYVVRHGKASAKQPGEKDRDRMLDAVGLRQSKQLGLYLYNKNANISAIVCSPAKRALQTAEQLADQLDYNLAKIVCDEDLYEASVKIVLEKVQAFVDDWQEVVMVGHNPVLSYFVEYVTGFHFDGLEAGSAVRIDCKVEKWIDLAGKSTSFEQYISPLDFE
jgi:phosphohistidine phosphatase